MECKVSVITPPKSKPSFIIYSMGMGCTLVWHGPAVECIMCILCHSIMLLHYNMMVSVILSLWYNAQLCVWCAEQGRCWIGDKPYTWIPCNHVISIECIYNLLCSQYNHKQNWILSLLVGQSCYSKYFKLLFQHDPQYQHSPYLAYEMT